MKTNVEQMTTTAKQCGKILRLMAGVKSKSGGARQGAGRRITRNRDGVLPKTIISKEARELLSYYSKELRITQAEFIDCMIIDYCHPDNKSIIHCPKCGKPLIYKVVNSKSAEVTCECGHVQLVE